MKTLFTFLLLFCFSNLIIAQFWDQNKTTATSRVAGSNYGESVYVDEDYILISAPGGGSNENKKEHLFIYKNEIGSNELLDQITFEETIISPNQNSRFGAKIDRSGDYIFIGTPNSDTDNNSNSGSIRIYKKESDNNKWVFTQEILPNLPQDNGFFGSRFDASGELLAVGTPFEDNGTDLNSGAVYIYSLESNGNWSFEEKLIASNQHANMQFGASICFDNNRLAIGAPNSKLNNLSFVGNVYLFDRIINSQEVVWDEVKLFTGPIIGASDRGFNFGVSVSIKDNVLVVGAPAERAINSELNYKGKVYVIVYDSADEIWNLEHVINASDGYEGDNFGFKVDLSDDYIAVKGSRNTENIHNGKIYLYKYDGTNWPEDHTFVSHNESGYDGFGFDFDINGSTILIGDSWDGLDVDGNNSISNAGSAYILNMTSINGVFSNNFINVEVFPNPTSRFIKLVSEENLNGLNYAIVAINGAETFKGKLENDIIDVQNLSRGIYYIKLETSDSKVVAIPFIKCD